MKKTRHEYDICVIGGGPGGLPAAIAAARQGARVVVVEKNGYLGGNATLGLPMLGYLDRNGRQVTGGIAEEFVQRLKAMGGSYGHSRCGLHNSVTIIHPELFKILAFQMCQEEKIDVLLHMETHQVNVESGMIRNVTFYGKGNEAEVSAKIFVDATGDGDAAYLAGCGYEMGQENTGALQPPTVMFSLIGVDEEKFFQFLDKNPDQMAFFGCGTAEYKDSYNVAQLRATPSHVFLGLRPMLAKWAENGECPVDRDTLIYINSMNPSQIYVNSTRLLNTDATDVFSLTRAETQGHLQIPGLIQMLQKHVPGFEGARLSHILPSLGVRETRRFRGHKCLTGKQVLACEIPEDAIALGSYIIDIHSAMDSSTITQAVEQPYGIPYGCLVSADVENLMLSGRCISMDAVALSSVRVMPTCMAIGEGAGIAAALAVQRNCLPTHVDVRELTAILAQKGAILK